MGSAEEKAAKEYRRWKRGRNIQSYGHLQKMLNTLRRGHYENVAKEAKTAGRKLETKVRGVGPIGLILQAADWAESVKKKKKKGPEA